MCKDCVIKVCAQHVCRITKHPHPQQSYRGRGWVEALDKVLQTINRHRFKRRRCTLQAIPQWHHKLCVQVCTKGCVRMHITARFVLPVDDSTLPPQHPCCPPTHPSTPLAYIGRDIRCSVTNCLWCSFSNTRDCPPHCGVFPTNNLTDWSSQGRSID